jgi:hypothetical protein
MSRYRLYPTSSQVLAMESHCRDARYLWNLCVEQQAYFARGHAARPPGHAERNRQLTEIRAEHGWLRTGSVNVQQQALRDFD